MFAAGEIWKRARKELSISFYARVQKHQLGFLSPTTHCLKFFADIFTLLS
jgi:hypothetical protein